MNKLKLFTLVGLCFLTKAGFAAEPYAPNPHGADWSPQMKALVDNWRGKIPTDPNAVLEITKNDNFQRKAEIKEFLRKNQCIKKITERRDINTAFGTFEDEFGRKRNKDIFDCNQLIRDNLTQNSELVFPVTPGGEYYILVVLEQEDGNKYKFIIPISSRLLKARNILEMFGYYCKDIPNELVPKIDDAIKAKRTFQDISRIHCYLLAKYTIESCNLWAICVPETTMIKYPWVTEDDNTVADDTYAVVQELIDEIVPVDSSFVNTLTEEELSQLYTFNKRTGAAWTLNNRWYVKPSDNKTGRIMVFYGLTQPDKNGPDYFGTHKDPLLLARTGIESLAKYIEDGSKQSEILLNLIGSDSDCSEDFRKTLEKMFYKGQRR